MQKSAEQGADYADTDYAASKEKKTSMEWSFDYNGLFEDSTAKKGKPSKKSKSKKKKKKGKSNKDKSKDYEDDDSEKEGADYADEKQQTTKSSDSKGNKVDVDTSRASMAPSHKSVAEKLGKLVGRGVIAGNDTTGKQKTAG